jgi:hypothetical protein
MSPPSKSHAEEAMIEPQTIHSPVEDSTYNLLSTLTQSHSVK